MRLIDADAVDIEYRGGFHDDYVVNYNSFINAPTIEAVSVVHGEWIEQHEDGHGFWIGTCSQCHNTERVANFCPNCGARMKGADDE